MTVYGLIFNKCGFVIQVEDEVIRLSKLKITKIKEVILRKKLELEEISRKVHMAPQVLRSENFSIEGIESGKPFLSLLTIMLDGHMLIIGFLSSFRCQGS